MRGVSYLGVTTHSISLQQGIDVDKERGPQREGTTTARDDDDDAKGDAGRIPHLHPADLCVDKENMRLALLPDP